MERRTLKKKNKIIWLSIVVVIALCFVIKARYESSKKQVALDECKNKAETLCSNYGIESENIAISYSQKYEEYDVYILRVNGSFTDVSNKDLYQFVRTIDSLMIDYDNVLLLNNITLNGKVYNLGILNEKELECDGTTIYTYVSDDEKAARENWKNRLPCVGMREEYLEYTSLGKADSIEKCRDFDHLVARAQSKTYEWEATEAHGWYEVTVYYRKHRSHRVDDYEDLPSNNGYVESITYIGTNGQMKTDYYRDTY